MSTTFSKKSKNLFFSSDVTVFSLHEQHDASLNFWFRTHIILAKNVPWHILTPSAVACDMFLLRASAHPRGAFFIHRTQFPMNKIESGSPDSRTEVRLH